MAVVSIASAGKGRAIVTLDGKDDPDAEMSLAINAPGIQWIEQGKVPTATRISKNKYKVTIN